MNTYYGVTDLKIYKAYEGKLIERYDIDGKV